MLQVEKLYRSSYVEEDVIVEGVMTSQKWTFTSETVANQVTNNQISNKAVVIGNGLTRNDVNLNKLIGHHSGLLGADTLQTYGCNAAHRDLNPDFLVLTSAVVAEELKNSEYRESHVVYTDHQLMTKYPGKFYLIPHNVYSDAGTLALRTACFDGHTKVFMVGMEGHDTPGVNYNVYAGTDGYDAYKNPGDANIKDSNTWALDKARVMEVYDDVEFYLVTESGSAPTPASWDALSNFSQIDIRTFVVTNDL
jgi:hypothetical protein